MRRVILVLVLAGVAACGGTTEPTGSYAVTADCGRCLIETRFDVLHVSDISVNGVPQPTMRAVVLGHSSRPGMAASGYGPLGEDGVIAISDRVCLMTTTSGACTVYANDMKVRRDGGEIVATATLTGTSPTAWTLRGPLITP